MSIFRGHYRRNFKPITYCKQQQCGALLDLLQCDVTVTHCACSLLDMTGNTKVHLSTLWLGEAYECKTIHNGLFFFFDAPEVVASMFLNLG